MLSSLEYVFQGPIWLQRKSISISLTQGILHPSVGEKLLPITTTVPIPWIQYPFPVLHPWGKSTSDHKSTFSDSFCQATMILNTEKPFMILLPRLAPATRGLSTLDSFSCQLKAKSCGIGHLNTFEQKHVVGRTVRTSKMSLCSCNTINVTREIEVKQVCMWTLCSHDLSMCVRQVASNFISAQVNLKKSERSKNSLSSIQKHFLKTMMA